MDAEVSKLRSFFLAHIKASFCPTLPSLVLLAFARVVLGLVPHRPSVAFAYGFGRARVPSPSDPEFPLTMLAAS
ncbi:hypothetical protein C8R44DRAFT_765896 [Mycena epipterygia]|nr:hypothetical protein C8R44DRAFT_765896 [Mycena epipterygia]